MDHVLQLVDFSQSRNKDNDAKVQSLKHRLDVSDNEDDLRKLAQETWVDSRSSALQSIKEGLTLDGKFSENAEASAPCLSLLLPYVTRFC